MKKRLLQLIILVMLFGSAAALAQTQPPEPKMTVADRMAKARAAKAQKKEGLTPGGAGRAPAYRGPSTTYQQPAQKKLRGPNGEVVHTGERGAKYYINKNGNRTYLSSNQ